MTTEITDINHDVFTRKHSEYGRSYELLSTYKKAMAVVLSRTNSTPLEHAAAFIEQTVGKGGTHEVKSPKVFWLERGENGDRSKRTGTLDDYLDKVTKNQYILSPSMAAYLPPSKKKSLYSDLMVFNKAKRSKSKHEMFEADVAGDVELKEYKNVEQTTFKIKNNSLSGAHASQFTMLFNKSAHSTLTSTCRAMTTTNNSHSERFLAGNRHYYNPTIVLANILSIIENSELDNVELVMTTYNLNYPTTEQVLTAIRRSWDLYMSGDMGWDMVVNLVNNLTPIELAAYAYTSDLYTLNITNKAFVETMLLRLSERHDVGIDDERIDLRKLDEETSTLLGTVFMKDLKGSNIPNILKHKPEVARSMRITVLKLQETLEYYSLYFKVLLASNSAPASIGEFTSSIRRAVSVSDTDSTVYSVGEFVKSKYNTYSFSDEARGYGAAVSYLNNRLTGHWLAMLSTHMGIGEDKMRVLSMKPEFGFPVIFMTGKAKHYCMRIDSCEGVFYGKPKLDLKGVSFRSSKIPKVIRDSTVKMIEQVMDAIEREEPIDGFQILTDVANEERTILKSVEDGGIEYLSTAQVREEKSYKNPESSPFAFKPLWDAIYGPKYGDAPEPPYQAVKVSLELSSKTKVSQWLDSLEDVALCKRYREYMLRTGRKQGSHILVPLDVVKAKGIPKEIVAAMNTRKLVSGLMESRYLAIESLGMYETTKNKIKLISDTY